MRRKHLQTFRYVFSHCLSCIRKDSSPCKVLNLLVVGIMSKTYLNINADFLRPCSDLYDIVDFVQHCSTLYVLVRLRTNWLSYVRPCSTMLDIVGFVQICSILYDLFSTMYDLDRPSYKVDHGRKKSMELVFVLKTFENWRENRACYP